LTIFAGIFLGVMIASSGMKPVPEIELSISPNSHQHMPTWPHQTGFLVTADIGNYRKSKIPIDSAAICAQMSDLASNKPVTQAAKRR
jgi:zinc transporter ZupT